MKAEIRIPNLFARGTTTMALFYASGSGRSDLGKFRQHRRPGLQQDDQHQFGKYRIELLSMESNEPIRRTHYHARIYTGRNIRVGFLRDFSSPSQAMASAKEWIAERESTRHKTS
jgi:hypothetical protein